jgi:YHS domain-containing protein
MIRRRQILTAAAIAPVALALPRGAHAAEPRVFQSRAGTINGIDPVAYFDGNGPVTGSADFTHDWDGATWFFANASNRDAFAAEPERFAPVFGGYCAFAASRGYLAPTIPEAWSIYDERLFLNANLRARELWTAELPDVIAQGEANWPAILG